MTAMPEPTRATVKTDVNLESGGILRAGTHVTIWNTVDDWYGIQWSDSEGNHLMAISGDKVIADRTREVIRSNIDIESA